MGADLYWEARRADEGRGRKYVKLKAELCKILELPWEWDVGGPGNDIGTTDQQLLAAVRSLAAGN